MKSWWSKLFLAVTLTALLAVPAVASSFRDVSESDWYYEELDMLVERGIVSGYEDGTFRPSNSVTLGEVAKMLYIYQEDQSLDNGANHWADNYAQGIYSLTWVDSVPEDLNAGATRVEVIEMVLASMGFLADPFYDSPFGDIDNSAANTLYDMGIINGSNEAGGLVLRGDDVITRAEFCAILDRVETYMTTEYGVTDFRYQQPRVTVPGDPSITYDYFYNAILYMMVTEQESLTMTFFSTSEDYLWETKDGDTLLEQAFEDVVDDYHEYGAFYDTMEQELRSIGSTVAWTVGIYDGEFSIGDTFAYQRSFLLGMPSYAQQIADAGMITSNMSDYDAAEYLYRYMIQNFAYDNNLNPISFNGYGMLSNGVGVCQGYVSVYNVLCKLFGMDVVGVSGQAGGDNHIWSYANLEGEWLYIDTTWGDCYVDGVTADMSYFAVSYNKLSNTHTFDNG